LELLVISIAEVVARSSPKTPWSLRPPDMVAKDERFSNKLVAAPAGAFLVSW
jgi:hypothetical protein